MPIQLWYKQERVRLIFNGYSEIIYRTAAHEFRRSKSPKSSSILPEQVATTHFKTGFFGNGIDHMNINLFGLPVNILKSGDELAVFDGQTCVGAITLMPHHLQSQTASIAASAKDN